MKHINYIHRKNHKKHTQLLRKKIDNRITITRKVKKTFLRANGIIISTTLHYDSFIIIRFNRARAQTVTPKPKVKRRKTSLHLAQTKDPLNHFAKFSKTIAFLGSNRNSWFLKTNYIYDIFMNCHHFYKQFLKH